MKTIIITIISSFILVSTPARAQWSTWTDTNKQLFVASSLAMAADWSTTRYATRHWDDNIGHESNKILGKYPSTKKLDAYFAILLISNYYIADSFKDSDTRNVYLTTRTVIHGLAARHNIEVGWQLRF